MFQSNTERSDAVTSKISPGPCAYDQDITAKLKRDFSRPRAVYAGPTRNLDGALTKPGVSPMLQAKSIEIDA